MADETTRTLRFAARAESVPASTRVASLGRPQTSWGFTTRSIGVMVMMHSDDTGLVL